MRTAKSIVDQEVYYNVSYLMGEITKTAEHFPEYYDELILAFETDPDYEECLIQNSWESFTDEFGAHCWKDNDDGFTTCGTAREVCEEMGLDADEFRQEVLEHWIVSDWLADKLEDKGERVLRDFMGLTIWGRTTSGQAIEADYVIQEVARDTES